MENIRFTREKVITSISRIENIKESLWFNDDNDFDNINEELIFLKYLQPLMKVSLNYKDIKNMMIHINLLKI